MELVGYRDNLGLLSEMYPGRASLTVDEFAVIIGVNSKTVRSAIAGRKLSTVRVGRRILIPFTSAARFMSGGKL